MYVEACIETFDLLLLMPSDPFNGELPVSTRHRTAWADAHMPSAR